MEGSLEMSEHKGLSCLLWSTSLKDRLISVEDELETALCDDHAGVGYNAKYNQRRQREVSRSPFSKTFEHFQMAELNVLIDVGCFTYFVEMKNIPPELK